METFVHIYKISTMRFLRDICGCLQNYTYQIFQEGCVYHITVLILKILIMNQKVFIVLTLVITYQSY